MWSRVPGHGARGAAALAKAAKLSTWTTRRYLRLLEQVGLVGRCGNARRNRSWVALEPTPTTLVTLEALVVGRKRIDTERVEVVDAVVQAVGETVGDAVGDAVGATVGMSEITVPDLASGNSRSKEEVVTAFQVTDEKAFTVTEKSLDVTADKDSSLLRDTKAYPSANLSNPTKSSASTVESGITESPNSDQRPVDGDLAATPFITAGQDPTPLAAPAPLHDPAAMLTTLLALQQTVAEQLAEIHALQQKVARYEKVKKDRSIGTPAQEVLAAQVFADWQESTGYHDRTLVDKRRRFLIARVRNGFTREQFSRVWAHARLDSHLQGVNDRGTKYDDITTLCRSRSDFERYLAKPVGNLKKQFSDSPNLMPKPDDEVKGYRL